jgi:predicted membrane protein
VEQSNRSPIIKKRQSEAKMASSYQRGGLFEMVNENIALRGVVFVLSTATLFIVWYLWYAILKQINATDFMWFIFVFMIFFGIITQTFRYVLEDGRIKDLQKRVKALEEKK